MDEKNLPYLHMTLRAAAVFLEELTKKYPPAPGYPHRLLFDDGALELQLVVEGTVRGIVIPVEALDCPVLEALSDLDELMAADPIGSPADVNVIDLLALAQPYQEALAVFEAFRRYGIDAESIFMVVQTTTLAEIKKGFGDYDDFKVGDEAIVLFMQARQNGREFNVICGPVRGTEEEVRGNWLRICDSMAGVSTNVVDQIWHKSRALASFNVMANEMRKRGFMIKTDWEIR
jgi:hypothetical protein